MVESIYCSAVCAIGIRSCGDEIRSGKSDYSKKKSCCAKEPQDGKQDNGCQKNHVSFFKTIGKFFTVHEVTELKEFQALPTLIYPILNLQVVQSHFSSFSSNLDTLIQKNV